MSALTTRICALFLSSLLLPSPVRAQVDRIFASGFEIPALVLLNEVNANISGSRDLVELRVTAAGSTLGIALVQDPVASGGTVLANLPQAEVALGDLIVVHLTPTEETDETVSKTDCVASSCYITAWDLLGGGGIGFANHVLGIRDASGTLIDAVSFAKSSGSSPQTFLDSVATLQSQGLWLPADCGGAQCTDTSLPTVSAISVDWTNLGATVTGNSVQRHGTSDTNQAGDWSVTAPTWGVPNL